MSLASHLGELRSRFIRSLAGVCVGAVVGCTEESDARFLREAYPELFFLIPGYGAQGGKARVAATLLSKAGGVVNSSRALLCAWKNDADLLRKADEGVITFSDMADAAARSALSAKKELCALA